MDIVPDLVPQYEQVFKKGDQVVISVDVSVSNNRTVFLVNEIKKAS